MRLRWFIVAGLGLAFFAYLIDGNPAEYVVDPDKSAPVISVDYFPPQPDPEAPDRLIAEQPDLTIQIVDIDLAEENDRLQRQNASLTARIHARTYHSSVKHVQQDRRKLERLIANIASK
jgi:hypothetical protein